MKRIQILKTGDAVSSDGIPYSFSSDSLREIAETYNPSHFKAPVIVSYPAHATKGIADNELHASQQLAFGAPDHLEVDGNKLYAVFTEITKPITQVFDWIKDKRILGFSASIYPPTSVANPYPGKHALRHIASCGVNPPAIKGMDVQFAEALSFSASDGEGALDFASPVDFGYGSYHLVSMMRSLREWFIAQYDLDTANEIIPSFVIDDMAMGNECSCNLSEVRERLARLTPKDFEESAMAYQKGEKKKEMADEAMEDDDEEEGISMSEQDNANAISLSEAKAENERLKAEIAAQKVETAKAQTQLRRTEIASFTEHLTPAQKGEIALSFGEGESEELSLENFLLELNERHYGFMKGWIEGMPNMVEFGEFAKGGDAPAATASSSEIAKHVQAIADDKDISFNEAYREYITSHAVAA